MSCSRSVIILAAVWLVVGAAAMPVRRSPDLEARRRSAVDRSMIRFGRSYPQEPTAADLREAFQLPSRRGNSFLRFGRSQPLTISTEDLVALLKAYEDEFDTPTKKPADFDRFIRNGSFSKVTRPEDDKRNPIFERVVKSTENNNDAEQISELLVSGYPQRKSRARDHFIRLGRDNEELNDESEEEESRNKRSADHCSNCQS